MISGRRVAIDFGAVRIGIAVTDLSGKFASPRPAISPENLFTTLREFAGELAVVYVGMPRHLSGVEGESAKRAREVAAKIKGELGVEVRLVDERLTTKSASERQRIQPALKKFEVDSIAALEILEFAVSGEANLEGFFGEAI